MQVSFDKPTLEKTTKYHKCWNISRVDKALLENSQCHGLYERTQNFLYLNKKKNESYSVIL